VIDRLKAMARSGQYSDVILALTKLIDGEFAP
jgi:hypothetical protein